ncbi:hypothetical protein ABT112_07895 [Streptomyces sp. NPDC002055]|uniref:hypothetical protein n=1 Tax=Streptomyces sp. NPDC002055 TaxID=3154534 RepID=UPI0033250732
MKLSYRIASAALVGLTLVGTAAAQVQAVAPVRAVAESENASPEMEAFKNKLETLTKESTVLEGVDAQKWLKQFNADLGRNTIGAHLDTGSSLTPGLASVYRLSNGNTQVSVPIGGQVRGASMNAVYSSSGALVETLEMQLTHDKQTGHTQVWRNGSKIADKILKVADLPKDLPADPTAQGSSAGKPAITTKGFSFSKFNDCLSGAGISAWTVGLISVACGAVCAGTAGAGCIPCLTAAGGVGAGTVWFCVGKATK